MLSDGEGEGPAGGREHFSFPSILRAEKEAANTKKRKKRKRPAEEGGVASEFKVDVTDPRFKAVYDSHLFAPDPSAPQYRWVWFQCQASHMNCVCAHVLHRATKGMSEIMAERRRRGQKQHQQDPATGQAVADTRYIRAYLNLFNPHPSKTDPLPYYSERLSLT